MARVLSKVPEREVALVEQHLNEQIDITIQVIQNKFGPDKAQLQEHRDLIKAGLLHAMAAKVWLEGLEKTRGEKANQFIQEIISNANQVVVLGALGYRIASNMMLRRSLENVLGYIYYRDHPVENFKREALLEDSKFVGSQGLTEYISDFPFRLLYSQTEADKVKEITRLCVISWKSQYKELSRYVHSQSKNFLELQEFIEDIEPSSEFLSQLTSHITQANALVNTLLILSTFTSYKQFSEDRKTIIRLSIPTGLNYKKRILETFNEI